MQDRTANPANLAAFFCPALVYPQKAIVVIKFLIFAVPMSSRHEKWCQILERPPVAFHHFRNIISHSKVQDKRYFHIKQNALELTFRQQIFIFLYSN